MDALDMQYDFKMKLNKLDSQQRRNFLLPEIDWLLNEAQELYVKQIFNPRESILPGFETEQRSRDTLRTLIENRQLNLNQSQMHLGNGNTYESESIPSNYMFLIKVEGHFKDAECYEGKDVRVYVEQYDDEAVRSPFNRSSLLWREFVLYMADDVFLLPISKEEVEKFRKGTGKQFESCLKLILTYLRKPRTIYTVPKDGKFKDGYVLPSGEKPYAQNQSVSCELPEFTHREIVDLAVSIAAGIIKSEAYENYLHKLNMNQLILKDNGKQ